MRTFPGFCWYSGTTVSSVRRSLSVRLVESAPNLISATGLPTAGGGFWPALPGPLAAERVGGGGGSSGGGAAGLAPAPPSRLDVAAGDTGAAGREAGAAGLAPAPPSRLDAAADDTGAGAAAVGCAPASGPG